jgi:hypothetical protein
MTTIAYKDGILAADTQLTMGYIRGLCRKIERWPGGEVVASAGNEEDHFVFKNWYHGDKKKIPKIHKTFELFMIDIEGHPLKYNNLCIPIPIDDPVYAYGSGDALARGAMAYGLSAKEAVKFASEIDVNTNNIVDTYDSKKKRLTLAKFPS